MQFYRKNDYRSEITPLKLTQGELFLKINPRNDEIRLNPFAEFILISENSSPLELKYDSNSSMSYSLETMNFLNESDYQKEIEKTKVYTIDYEFKMDSTLKKKIEHLPFKNIWGTAKGYSSYASQTIKPDIFPLGHNVSIPNGTNIFICDKLTVRGKDYYKAVHDGKAFFIECSNINIDNKDNLNILLSEPQEVRNAFLDFAKIMSRYRFLKEREDNLRAFNEMIKKGFSVLKANPYDMSEYTDGTGMEFSFLNTSDKTIKYITINFIGYNAVDDPVSSGGKTVLTRKGIGPIEPFETGSYDFEYVWFTDIVDYSKIKSIVVQYMDGSTKTFSGASVEIVPEKIINAMDYRSPVESFLPDYDDN